MEQSFEYVKYTPHIEIHHPGLTSSEIGNLWNNYVDGTVIICFLKSFLRNIEDQEIKTLLEENISILNQREAMIKDIFDKEGLVLPQGFSENRDLDLKAPRLYSDYFYLHYARCTLKFEIPLGGLDLVTSTRSDVLEYFAFRMSSSTMLFKKIIDLLLEKGFYVRPPHVVVSDNVQVVSRQSFLTGFLGEKRSLLAQEISSAFHLILSNSIARFMLMGFRQTTRNEKVQQYMDRGIKLTSEMINSFSSILETENIPVPAVSDYMVTESTVPPLSDRLMMKQLSLFSNCGLLLAAYQLKNSPRHDIKASVIKAMPASADYAEDGINIMIENGWFEEPPKILDRRELVNKKNH